MAEGNGGNGDARRIGSVCARGFKIKLRLRVGGPACDPEDEACVKESRELPVKEIEKDCIKSGWSTIFSIRLCQPGWGTSLRLGEIY